MTTRSPASHLELGAEGETRAARHLVRRGYRIVARNVRAGGVELDLVVRRGRIIVFVEVKARRSVGEAVSTDMNNNLHAAGLRHGGPADPRPADG